MHCFTEGAAGKAHYDAGLLAANKLTKGKTGDMDAYGGGKRTGAAGG